jgi:hypothetical protein
MHRALRAFFALRPVSSAQLTHTHQLLSSHPQIRQGEQCGQLRRVFYQPTKAHIHVTKLALDYPKWMLNFQPFSLSA